MNFRINAGYIITDSVHVGEMEFVLGVHSTAANQFVTWACKDGNNYFWGHYFNDLMAATKDLIDRAEQEVKFCMSREEKTQPLKKEAEEPSL